MTVKERQAAMLAAQQEAQDSELSRVLTSMHSRLQSMQEQQETIAKTVEQLVTAQNGSSRAIKELISRAPETSSAAPPSGIAQLQSSVREVGETLKLLSETVSGSQAVELPSGEKVKRSDLDALELTRGTSARVQVLSSSVDQLTKAVRAKAQVSVDADKVAAVVVGRVAEASEKRVTALFETQEQRLALLGEQQASQVAAQLAESAAALKKAEDRLGRLSGALTWQGVARVALALVPFAIVALVAGQLLGLVSQLLGIGPLAAWAWGIVWDDSVAWHGRALVALATLAVVGGLGWLLHKVSKRLAGVYRGW